MHSLFPVTLTGRFVRLEPLSHAHVDALVAAASESRETYALTTVPPDAGAMAAYVDFALAGAARGDMVPFATVDARFDGIIRAHMPAADGVVVRDSAFYSLLADEWPTARDRLAARLLG